MFYLYDNVKRMVASYSYDDIGRLVSLKRSGNVGMVNYAYNIRNWLNETKSDFIFEDGKLDKYLFDGGYCSFDNNQNPTFHYYEKDHLGSIRTEPTLKSKACLKCLYFTKIISDLCRYLEYFSYLYTIN